MKPEKPTVRPPVVMDSSEWEFWMKCPDEELEECLVYEFARRSTLWPVVFATLRPLGSPEDFCPQDTGWASIYEFLCACPEFPEKPWMSIESSERRQRLNALSKRAHQWQPVESNSDWKYGAGDGKDQRDEGSGPWWNGIEIFAKYRSRAFNDQLTTLRIDWNRKDNEIVEAFAKWIKRGRNGDFWAYARRGKTASRSDVMRATLRALGAWSLSPRFNPQAPQDWTRSDAFKHSIVSNEYGKLAPLYPHVKEMGKAERKAVKFINHLTPWNLEFAPRFPLFSTGDLVNPPELILKLAREKHPISKFMWSEFSVEAQRQLLDQASPNEYFLSPGAKQELLIAELNKMQKKGSIYTDERFAGVNLSPRTCALKKKNPRGDDLVCFNRLLLEDAYPAEFRRARIPKTPRRTKEKRMLQPATTVQNGIKIEHRPDGLISFQRV